MNILNTKIKQKGFTLLEILIVVIIISTMAAIVLTSNSSGRAKTNIDVAGRELAAVLREAQNNAMSGKQFVSGTDPCLFLVGWNSGSPNYTVTYYYKNSVTGACTENSVIGNYTMRNGVAFSNSGSFGFTLPHGNITDPSTVSMTLSGDSQVGVVCIYKAGGLVNNRVGSASCP